MVVLNKRTVNDIKKVKMMITSAETERRVFRKETKEERSVRKTLKDRPDPEEDRKRTSI